MNGAQRCKDEDGVRLREWRRAKARDVGGMVKGGGEGGKKRWRNRIQKRRRQKTLNLRKENRQKIYVILRKGENDM